MKQRALGAGSSTLGFAALLLSLLFVHPMAAPADQTAAGTVITNTSGASYTDLNSFTYSATSNEVSITVQNAPSMTITQGTSQTVAPGQTVTDSFIITNTGNAAGTVTLTAGGVTGGGDSASATVTYDCSTCTGGPQNLAGLNSELQSLPIAAPTSGTPSPSITVEVMYTLSADAASSNTSSNTAGTDDVQTNLTGTITYPAVTGASAATSTSVSATSFEDDWVKTDAFLNVGLSSTTSGGTITYTANIANGSTTWPAKDLASVKALLGLPGLTNTGLFISVKVPQYPANTPLTITGTPTVTTSAGNGFATGATAVIYSTADSTGASGWTAGATPVANATYIGVFIKGGSCALPSGLIAFSSSAICANANAANSSPGNVTTANAAVSLSFAVTASTASGSANANSTTTIANTLIGNNADTELVVGPGLITVADSSSITDITATGEGINNTTSLEAPSGASTVASTQSSASYSIMNGPFGYPSATGTYDGLNGSTLDTNHDFTIVSFASTNTYQTTNTTGSDIPTTSSTTASSVSNINVENTVANLGNATDSVTLAATAPSGWTVELESDNAGVPGSALGAASSLATYAATVSIASGASLNYWAVYTAPSGVSYLSHAIGTIVATSGNDMTKTNTTVNIIYAGFVAVTTTATTTPNCPAGTSPPTGSVCPGGTIMYTIDYRNIVNHADVSSEPQISFAQVMTKPGTLVITADGTGTAVSGNNWATTTNGPNAEPVDTTSGTTYTYWSGSNGATLAASFQTGLTKFIATVGGSTFQLAPFGFSGTNYKGTITYSVTAH